MRTGLRLQSGHGHKTAQHSLHALPSISLFPFPLSYPSRLLGKRDCRPFTYPTHRRTVLLYCRMKRRPAS
jgi:hypothetical protein